MNAETPDMNTQDAVDESVASMVNTLIQVADPRLVVKAMLSNAAGLSQLIIHAKKGTHAQIAHAFSQMMVQALTAPSVEEDEPRIQVAPANPVIDLSKRR